MVSLRSGTKTKELPVVQKQSSKTERASSLKNNEDANNKVEKTKKPQIKKKVKKATPPPPSPPEAVEIENKIDNDITIDEDDDDAPEEATSKVAVPSQSVESKPVEEIKEGELSNFEKIMEKKSKKEKKKKEKQLEKKIKKKNAKKNKKAIKVSEGVFKVKINKKKKSFKVVTLQQGVHQLLEPSSNYREELLKSRTEKCRLTNTEKFAQRSKWVSHRREAD